MAKLTDKQKKFIDEYMIDLNATQAYIRAGFSPNGAKTHGPKLLHNVAIAEEIDKRKAEASKIAGITRNEILNDLKVLKNNYLISNNSQHALKAIELINKMLGFNEPEKTETRITGIDIKKLLDFED